MDTLHSTGLEKKVVVYKSLILFYDDVQFLNSIVFVKKRIVNILEVSKLICLTNLRFLL